MASEHYSYCFVRQDLSALVQTIQAGHAWWDVASDGEVGDYRYQKTNFVLIGVANEQELLARYGELKLAKVPMRLFWEPDGMTGFTAFATLPLSGTERAPLARFSILRETSDEEKDEGRLDGL